MRLSRVIAGLLVMSFAFLHPEFARAQVRGVYPAGMSATNAGVTPESGFSYSNLFLLYARDELRGSDGELLEKGHNSVIIDMNTFVWVSTDTILGGARFSAAASLPIANNSLSSETTGAISGGGGFADSYYQPAILGWQLKRIDFRVMYGFLAPTGRFEAGATDNVGSGYWTHTLASGQTFYLTEDRQTALSAFVMYEFHGSQEDTGVRPGDTFNLDYSLTRNIRFSNDVQWQLGLIGYQQRQTSDKRGPGVTPEQSKAHYTVDALGLSSNVTLASRKVSLGFKYYQEFSSRSTLQGYSVQISAFVKL
jgi:hypothetical protein